MANDQVTLIGNFTRDPELRFTPTGRAVVQIGIAVNRRYQVNGEWTEQTSFFDVVAWGELGENVAASLGKGSRAIVVGRLDQRSWYVDADGKSVEKGTEGAQTRSKVEVVADSIGPDLRWATAEVSKRERQGGAPMPTHPQDVDVPAPEEEPF